MKPNKIKIYLILFLISWGCMQKTVPELDEWVEGIFQPRMVREYRVSGKRDGATTRVSITYVLASGERVQLELEVVYNPIPVLRSGYWSIDGIKSGAVEAESLTFLGGQGEGPSLGGRFLLKNRFSTEEDHATYRFRAVVPLGPVNKPNW